MGGVFFLASFVCLGIVIVWFIRNESQNGGGHLGLLAVRPSESVQGEKSDMPAARYSVREARKAIEKDLGELEHVRRIAAEKAGVENTAHAFRKKEGAAYVSTSTRRHRKKARVKPVSHRNP